MTVEIIQACGDWEAGMTLRMDERRARGLIRCGYAREVESAVVTAKESAAMPPRLRKTTITEKRG